MHIYFIFCSFHCLPLKGSFILKVLLKTWLTSDFLLAMSSLDLLCLVTLTLDETQRYELRIPRKKCHIECDVVHPRSIFIATIC